MIMKIVPSIFIIAFFEFDSEVKEGVCITFPLDFLSRAGEDPVSPGPCQKFFSTVHRKNKNSPNTGNWGALNSPLDSHLLLLTCHLGIMAYRDT